MTNKFKRFSYFYKYEFQAAEYEWIDLITQELQYFKNLNHRNLLQ